MAWKLAGTYFETCSCEVVCPCTASLALGADYDRCKVTLVFNVRDGDVDGTDVSGLTVAAVADTPKVMSEGNWRLGVFIDAAASDQQAEALGAVFSGQLGGPMEALGPLVSENLGVERAPIEVRVGAPVADQQAVTCVIPGHHQPGAEHHGELLRVADGPLAFELDGRCAYQSVFAYSGP